MNKPARPPSCALRADDPHLRHRHALLRQAPSLQAVQVFFLALILIDIARGAPWAALGAFGGLGACLLVPAVREKSRFTVPIPVDRATGAFVFATIFLGERVAFYDRFWWWDLAAHFLAGVLLCNLAAILFDQLTQAGPRLLRALFIFGLSVAGAALWEVVEYLLDLVFDADAQRGSLDDTMTDILAHVLGALLATAGLVRRGAVQGMGPRQPGPVQRG
ncbi:hypothetical protein ACFQXB_09705 [Plastorhodobacter daqingensis]|uniref:DUF2238 domain-containing protein n=1 Tax=Plastorhodobacter daqingensis TaxID=1387281 RepID=A0ABW2UIG6_9RHOB